MRRIAIGLLLPLCILGASCASDDEVGSGIDVETLSEEADRLGELEVPEEGAGGFVGEEEARQAERDGAADQVEQGPAELGPEDASVAVEITASGYDPYVIRVFVGGVVVVTNADTVPRTVTADRGEFDSGEIAPGASWSYTATQPGKFNVHDETRPFVVGSIEVLEP